MEDIIQILGNEPEKNLEEYKIKRSLETTEKDIFETKTHVFKINSEKLEELEDKKNFVSEISKKIQKGMKQTVDKATGSDWEKSYRLILHEITGQWTLEVDDVKDKP